MYYTEFLNKDNLPENGIFTFGSNPIGINGNIRSGKGGAALIAQLEFGVKPNEIMNNCLSESGKAYGLVTVDAPKKYISKERIVANIKVLYKYARKNSDKLFYVAYDGKYPDAISLNGKSRKVLASLFFQAGMDLYLRIPENIVFEKDFHILIYGSLNIASFYI